MTIVTRSGSCSGGAVRHDVFDGEPRRRDRLLDLEDRLGCDRRRRLTFNHPGLPGPQPQRRAVGRDGKKTGSRFAKGRHRRGCALPKIPIEQDEAYILGAAQVFRLGLQKCRDRAIGVADQPQRCGTRM